MAGLPGQLPFLTALKPDYLRALAGQGSLHSGLSIHGCFRSQTGLGEATRQLAKSAMAAQLPFVPVEILASSQDRETDFDALLSDRPDRVATLQVLGLTAIPLITRRLDPRKFNMLYAFWELDTVPRQIRHLASRCDEIWTPGSFVHDVFAAFMPGRTCLVPQPVELPDEQPGPREDRIGLKVLSFFDYDSFFERKNPLASIRAFQAAFPASQRDVSLTIKTRGANDAGRRADLLEIAASDPRITILDDYLTRQGMRELLREHDVFISLHRSEGFGFGPAEAIAQGRVAIATDYGGTTDYLNPQTGYPVSFSMRPVPPGAYVHADRAQWAEPDIDHASAILRAIYDRPQEADDRARAGFAYLRANHSHQAVGKLIHSLAAARGIV